jgi:RNA polymerase sigma-70 factor (ECF subfamily)
MRFTRRRPPRSGDPAQLFDALVRRAKAGDDHAVEQLYCDHVAVVYGYLRASRVPDPEDLTSEVFAGMLRGLHRFEGGQADFRRWLMTIAHHRLVDQRRRSLRDKIDLTEPGELDASWSGRQLVEAAAVVVDADLIAAFGALTEAQREVLALRFVTDASLQDVAEITGRPVAAVKSLQSRGLAALRKMVSDPSARQGATQ